MNSEDRHTWFYKKILEKFKSYQDFAKSIYYEPATIYYQVVAQRPPSDELVEKMAEIFGMKPEEIKDYMLDDYDTDRKHYAETGEHYFTAKLDGEKATKVIIADKEYQFDSKNELISKKTVKKDCENSSIQKCIDEIMWVSAFLNNTFPQEIMVDAQRIDDYQKGLKNGLRIAVDILTKNNVHT